MVISLILFYDGVGVILMDTNTATLISGALSMLGGFAGAIGAYWVATHQTKKQFEKQDMDRVLELRIEKMNDALNIANEYLHQAQKLKGKIYNIEIYVKEVMEKHTILVANEIISKNIVENLLTEIKEFATFKDSLKKFKIFVPLNVDYQEIYDKTSGAVDSYKSFLKKFNGFTTSASIKTSDLKFNYDELKIKCDDDHKQLEAVLEKTIKGLETEILTLLEMNK